MKIMTSFIIMGWLVVMGRPDFARADDGWHVQPVAQGGSAYDGSGGYVGRMGSDGSTYDGSGGYTGRLDHDGSLYNGSGGYVGRLDSDGSAYDSNGNKAGDSPSANREAGALHLLGRLPH